MSILPDDYEMVIGLEVHTHLKTASKLFQWHNSTLKHGEATRIRYDPKTCTAGYSQARYDKWWAGVDKNGDGKMDSGEMKDMLGALTDEKADKAAAAKAQTFISKMPVFVLLYHAFKGDETGGVDEGLLQELYKGQWKGAELPREIPLRTILWGSLVGLMTGAM